MFQGIVEEVKPFISLEDAEAELAKLKKEHDIKDNDFEGTDIEGSTIYSTTLK